MASKEELTKKIKEAKERGDIGEEKYRIILALIVNGDKATII